MDALIEWLKAPEKGDKSVADMFFITGLQVFFAGVWYIIFRRMFGNGVVG